MHRDRTDNTTAGLITGAGIVFTIFLLAAAFIGPPWMWWLTQVSMGWRVFVFAGSVMVLSAVVRLLVMLLPLLDAGYGRHAKVQS
jgi:hypothetical protein